MVSHWCVVVLVLVYVGPRIDEDCMCIFWNLLTLVQAHKGPVPVILIVSFKTSWCRRWGTI